jgi:hypothetical protein
VDVQDHIRAGQVEHVRVAGDVPGVVVADQIAPVVGRGEFGALQHRAPGTVEHHDPLAQQTAQ